MVAATVLIAATTLMAEALVKRLARLDRPLATLVRVDGLGHRAAGLAAADGGAMGRTDGARADHGLRAGLLRRCAGAGKGLILADAGLLAWREGSLRKGVPSPLPPLPPRVASAGEAFVGDRDQDFRR